MLSRKYRADRQSIEKTIKSGLKISSNSLYSKVSLSNVEKPGFAIVISKKNEPTSVGRHLIKRRISDVLEKKIIKIKPDFKKIVVIFINSDFNKVRGQKNDKKIILSYSQIKKDLEDILVKIGF